jgi:hypothetical protein
LLERQIRDHLFNPNVEELHSAYPRLETLQPRGEYAPMRRIPLVGLAADDLAKLGKQGGRNLNLTQMRQIRAIETRTGCSTTDVLLEALDARWSDHCTPECARCPGPQPSSHPTTRASARLTRYPDIIERIDELNVGRELSWLKEATAKANAADSRIDGSLHPTGRILKGDATGSCGLQPDDRFEVGIGSGLGQRGLTACDDDIRLGKRPALFEENIHRTRARRRDNRETTALQ